MKYLLVFTAAALLYLPTVRFGFVQDDRAIIAANPAAHSVGAAVLAFGDPYWPRESGAGAYRPVTILSFAVDWSASGGRPAWLHFSNALWHGLASVLGALVLARWLTPLAALAAGLVFALHPVHVEAVAGLVGRSDLLAAVAMLSAVLAARRAWWPVAVGACLLAMLAKEHGVVAPLVLLLDDRLAGPSARRYPIGLYVALGATTTAYLAVWSTVGGAAVGDVAAPFLGVGTAGRLAIAFPAILQAGRLLVWPVHLSADYLPQVLPIRDGLSPPAVAGAFLVIGLPLLAFGLRRRAPAAAFGIVAGALAYLPTSNLLFASGVVLAERTLYLPVLALAAVVGSGIDRLQRAGRPAALAGVVALLALACAARSWARLPAWQDNRAFLLTLLADHPESYRAHWSSAAVLAGLRDTAGARREYSVADSLFEADPYLAASHAFYLLSLGDTVGAVARMDRAAERLPRHPVVLSRRSLLLTLPRHAGSTGSCKTRDSVTPSDSPHILLKCP